MLGGGGGTAGAACDCTVSGAAFGGRSAPPFGAAPGGSGELGCGATGSGTAGGGAATDGAVAPVASRAAVMGVARTGGPPSAGGAVAAEWTSMALGAAASQAALRSY